MKTLKITMIIALAAILITACGEKEKNNSSDLKTLNDSLSYCMGVQTNNFLDTDIENFNMAAFEKGIKDAKAKKPALTEEKIRLVMTRFMQVQKDKLAKKNLDDAKKFLAENKNKPGVKVTPSGLQYKVMKEGNGPRPTINDMVKVHYHGTFINGEIFDSSVKRGQAVEIPLKQVIPGWSEGIPLMTVGSKYKFFISPELGYGPNGMGPIAPNQCLIFEVELLEIVKNPAQPNMRPMR